MGKNIKNLPIDDRPYEKLELLGSENLSNSELLAIVIKTGKKNLNCLEIAQNVLNSKKSEIAQNDLDYLSNLSLSELKKFEGIGRVKAIQIKAVIELSKRISKNDIASKKYIRSPKDVFNLLEYSYIGKKQEILKTVLLDKSNKVVSVITNSIGLSDMVESSIKEVLCEPIKQMASSIILVHNHPSSNMNPSKNDIKFTNYIKTGADIFNVKLLDHVIICSNNYVSLYNLGYINQNNNKYNKGD